MSHSSHCYKLDWACFVNLVLLTLYSNFSGPILWKNVGQNDGHRPKITAGVTNAKCGSHWG